MNYRISGSLFSGMRASADAADLIIENDRFRFELASSQDVLGGAVENRALADLKIAARLGSIPRTIETLDGLRFETEDFSAVEKLETELRRSKFVFNLESRWRYVIPIAVSFVITVVLVFKVVIPRGALVIAPFVPRKVLSAMSKPIEMLFAADPTDVKAALLPDQRERLDQAQRELKALFSDQEDVDVLNDKNPNAFVLPDGHMYVTKGLIQIATTSDQILAVLLHERGHVAFHHVVQSYIENSSLSAMVIILTGGTEWSNVPILILGSSYSRLNESQADTYAVSTLDRIKKDPDSLAQAFELMKKATPELMAIPAFLSTHPGIDDRIADIRRRNKSVKSRGD
jgi:Zn-dependent protease with chaperone function